MSIKNKYEKKIGCLLALLSQGIRRSGEGWERRTGVEGRRLS